MTHRDLARLRVAEQRRAVCSAARAHVHAHLEAVVARVLHECRAPQARGARDLRDHCIPVVVERVQRRLRAALQETKEDRKEEKECRHTVERDPQILRHDNVQFSPVRRGDGSAVHEKGR